MLKLATKFVPQRDAFATAVQAGFEYAELWTSAKVLAQWQAVAEEAERHPLKYTLHFPNRSDLPAETIVQTVALYRRLGCRAMVIHEPQLRCYAERLRSLLPEICLAVENHHVTREELLDWPAQFETITIDFEHIWKFTLGDVHFDEFMAVAQGLIERRGHQLRHVHLPGYLPGYDEHRPMYCSREMIFGILEMLSKIDFAGFVVSEVDAAYQNLPELRMDVLLLEAWNRQRSGVVVSNLAD
jgi:sugar phosphate isomerase/epimerase